MSVIAFEYLKVTTTTLIMTLDGSVNLDHAFGLLKITRIQLPVPKRQTQKYKIPHCTQAGAVLSVRYRGHTRGIIRSTNGDHFKNSITIDVATKEKNVSIKLSSTKIQMCGASSAEQGLEGANHILNQLNDIQDTLDYMQAHPQRTQATIDWLRDITKGQPTQRMLSDASTSSSSESVSAWDQIQFESDYTLNLPLEPYPHHVDALIADFFIQLLPDYIYYNDFCAELDWISSVDTVIERPLRVAQVHKAMVNYNYDLGFTVDRFELAHRINGLNGFFARYENDIDHNVTVALPYKVPEHHKSMRRRNKNPCHVFLVYMSGLVTQSGPGEELMKDAYYLFNQTIRSLREHIMKPNIPRTLRYRPSWSIPANEKTRYKTLGDGIPLII